MILNYTVILYYWSNTNFLRNLLLLSGWFRVCKSSQRVPKELSENVKGFAKGLKSLQRLQSDFNVCLRDLQNDLESFKGDSLVVKENEHSALVKVWWKLSFPSQCSLKPSSPRLPSTRGTKKEESITVKEFVAMQWRETQRLKVWRHFHVHVTSFIFDS